MKTFQLIVGCILALGFFGVSIFGIRRKWKGKHIAACMVTAVAMFLISLDWVQGFVQTQAFTSLLRASKQYGEKLNEFQKTTGEMKVQLGEHQAEINTQQTKLLQQQEDISTAHKTIQGQQEELSTQQEKMSKHQGTLETQGDEIAAMQRKLLDAQEGIKKQQERLSDVENLVVDIYDRTRIELFGSGYTNSVLYFEKQDGGHVVIFKLADPPILKSIQGMYGNTPLRPTSYKHYGNILATVWTKTSTSVSNETYTITYVADPKGPKYTVLENRDGTVFVDGLRMTEELMP